MDCSVPGFPIYPSPTPRACSNSRPSHQWCHPTISSFVVPFSAYLHSFPTLGSFQMSQFFTSGGRNTGASASTSVLPMNIQDWFPLGWTGWISLQSKGLSRVFSNTIVQKHQFFGAELSLWSNSHPNMTTRKTIALTRWTFVDKVMSLLFNMLSRLVTVFLPRIKCLLISWQFLIYSFCCQIRSLCSLGRATIYWIICLRKPPHRYEINTVQIFKYAFVWNIYTDVKFS